MSAAPAVAGPERTPDWLVSSQVAMCPRGCIGMRKKGSFVEKTLDGGANLLRQTVFSEDAAARRGLLQCIDPRVKLLMSIALVVVAAPAALDSGHAGALCRDPRPGRRQRAARRLLPRAGVALTEQGLTSAGLVVGQVATSISLVVLLTLTTPWFRLLAALRSPGVPRVFILIIGMT